MGVLDYDISSVALGASARFDQAQRSVVLETGSKARRSGMICAELSEFAGPIMENIPESDDDLIRACRDGDAHAWDRLLHKYERLVFSIPLNYGLSRDDAADITQLTFMSLIQSLEALREGSSLGAWLALVARRNTWRVIERTRHESVGEYAELADSSAAIDTGGANPMERWELTEWLNQGLLALNERCRDLLLALYFEVESPSYSEIAARIGMPVGSVGPTRARCLERLKQILQDE